jgi:hypothetical protein
MPGRRASAARERIKSYAGLTIALGPGPVSGADCYLVIETFGPDVGAIIRSGAARAPSQSGRDKSLEDSHPAAALETGIFTTGGMIGETVAANEPLGVIGVTEVVSPVAGRIRGLQRTGRAVVSGAVVADIASRAATQVSGSGKMDQLIARGVAFAIEMEYAGWPPVSFDGFRCLQALSHKSGGSSERPRWPYRSDRSKRPEYKGTLAMKSLRLIALGAALALLPHAADAAPRHHRAFHHFAARCEMSAAFSAGRARPETQAGRFTTGRDQPRRR